MSLDAMPRSAGFVPLHATTGEAASVAEGYASGYSAGWSAGTRARTWATWAPQPDQVVFPQVRHCTARHMSRSSQATGVPASAASANSQKAS